MRPLASAIPGDNMQRAATFLGSSIGKKVVMAVTGLVLFGFVIGHMIGNLQIYLGPQGDQRLRGVPARLPARRGHLDRPRLAPRWRSALHIWAAVDPDPLELGGAPGRLPRVAGPRVHLRLAHHGLERARSWPPSSSTTSPTSPLGDRAPRVRGGRRLPQRGDRLPEPVRVGLLHARDARARPAPVPRRLEHAADARPEPPALEPAAPRVSLALLALDRGRRQHLDPLAVLAGLVHL